MTHIHLLLNVTVSDLHVHRPCSFLLVSVGTNDQYSKAYRLPPCAASRKIESVLDICLPVVSIVNYILGSFQFINGILS